MPLTRIFRALVTPPLADTAPPEARQRAGFWFLAGHVVNVWAIALSNAFLGLAMLWAAAHRRRFAGLWRRAFPVLAPLGAYGVFLVVSVATSLDPQVSAPQLRELLSIVTLPLTLVMVEGEARVRRIFDFLLVMVVLVALEGLAQYFLGPAGGVDDRIRGPFSHYQTFSGVLLVGDLLLVGRMAAGGWRQLRYWAAFGVVTWTLLATLTRGPWVVLAVLLPTFLWLRSRRLFAASLVAGVLLWTLAPGSLGARLHSIVDLRDPSNYDRLCMLRAGADMIAERPLFGIGPRLVRSRYPIYRQPTAPRFTVPHLHNTFLSLTAERGAASLAAYLLLMGGGLAAAYRAYRRPGSGPNDLPLGVLLAVVGFNLAGLFEDNWQDTEVQRLVLFLLAIPFCLGAGGRPDSEPAPEETPR